VERLVEGDVTRDLVAVLGDLLHHLVERGGRLLERRELAGRLEALCGEARRRPLEHAAELDRVGDVGERERADDEAAAGEALEQPLVGERRQREAERRARDAEPLRELDLGQAFAGAEPASEDELPEAERRLRRQRAGAVAACHVRASLNRAFVVCNRVRIGRISAPRRRFCMQP
jgi:hypothetical protein